MHGNAEVQHCNSPFLDSFIDEVQRVAAEEPDRAQTVRRLRSPFARLLKDEHWLPEEFTLPDPAGGMADGVGNYLIYRAADRDLTLMSLVLPVGVSTPVHDHLAWGLVGLYSGEQAETVFRRSTDDGEDGIAHLIEVEKRHLRPGDFYDLLPPEGDIHQVRTIGDRQSVSIHLLGNDIGCTWRHRFEPEKDRVYPFRSGYSNEACPDG